MNCSGSIHSFKTGLSCANLQECGGTCSDKAFSTGKEHPPFCSCPDDVAYVYLFILEHRVRHSWFYSTSTGLDFLRGMHTDCLVTISYAKHIIVYSIIYLFIVKGGGGNGAMHPRIAKTDRSRKDFTDLCS